MFIKHYKEVQIRVPDPLHPGQRVFDTRMDWSGTHAINHEGKTYEADPDGWFDVPDNVAAHLLGFPGWRTPDQVDEERSSGIIRQDVGDETPLAARLKDLEAQLERERAKNAELAKKAEAKPRGKKADDKKDGDEGENLEE